MAASLQAQRLARVLLQLGRGPLLQALGQQQQIPLALAQPHDDPSWVAAHSSTASCSYTPQPLHAFTRRASSSSLPSQTMQTASALSTPAQSLHFDRGPINIGPLDNAVGRTLLTFLGFYSKKSKLLHGGQVLYAAIKEQCDDGALIKAFNLEPDAFFSTYTLLSLHCWLLVHRLSHRTDGEARDFKQRFYNNFQYDVERRVHKQVSVGVNKWLKQLESVFYASGMDFDKVLSGESKETFTDVILRHFFGGDLSKKSQAALLAKYVHRELHCLQLTDDDSIFQGHIRFSREPFEALRAQGVGKDKVKGSQG